jgi:DNA-binding MarR family transcriptional regulator
MELASSNASSVVQRQYQMIHEVYVMLDDGDRRVMNVFGLTLPQYRVLSALNLNEGCRLTTLSDRLLRAKSTITRIIDNLEDRQLVRRTNDTEDRRAQRVVLTHAGDQLLEQAREAHEQSLERRMDQTLSAHEQRHLQDLLSKLHDGLAADLSAEDAAGPLNHQD